MKKRTGIRFKELLCVGVFSTVVMDIGEHVVKAFYPLSESLEPQYLGRWILNMFNGVFVHDDIQIANQFGFEIPVAILFHYLTGIVLVGIFLWLRNNIKNFPDSIFMGLVYGWVTLLLPWLIMFPALGFGFFGLGADNDMNNIAASILAHSFYGLGMTLWLGWAGKFITRIFKAKPDDRERAATA